MVRYYLTSMLPFYILSLLCLFSWFVSCHASAYIIQIICTRSLSSCARKVHWFGKYITQTRMQSFPRITIITGSNEIQNIFLIVLCFIVNWLHELRKIEYKVNLSMSVIWMNSKEGSKVDQLHVKFRWLILRVFTSVEWLFSLAISKIEFDNYNFGHIYSVLIDACRSPLNFLFLL